MRVWDLDNGRLELRPLRMHNCSVHFITISPYGKHVASDSDSDAICVWDLKTGEPIMDSFTGHLSHILSITILQNGYRVVFLLQ